MPPEKHPIVRRRTFIRNAALTAGGVMAIGRKLSAGPAPAVLGDKPGRFSRIALYQEPTSKGVRCMICPNECNVTENSVGDCGNRKNFGGRLYSIAYGNPCAVHIDPIEKKPLYHFFPQSTAFSIATAGCNFGCLNCQNWTISQTTPDKTRNEDLMPDRVVAGALQGQCRSIAYTYSEPTTFYEYMIDTARLAKARGLKNIYKSNGFINEAPLRELATTLDAANIDLKSFSNDIYTRLSSGKLDPVLRTLKVLNEMKVWLEITHLIIPGWTDDMTMFRNMCNWLHDNGFSDNPLHLSRFQPEYKLTRIPATPLPVLDRAREIAMETGIRYVYIGNVLNSPAESTYCSKCGKTVIERRGFTIVQNTLSGGKCSNCGQVIPGRWQ